MYKKAFLIVFLSVSVLSLGGCSAVNDTVGFVGGSVIGWGDIIVCDVGMLC